MFARIAMADDDRMIVRIFFDGSDPPTGRAGIPGKDDVAFTGWLGLLGALSSLCAGSGLTAPEELRGQPDARGDPELGEDVREMGLDGPA